MLNTILIIIGVIVAIIVVFFLAVDISACVISSRCNETMDEYQSDILLVKNEGDRKLSDLENQTLERLLQAYEEDGINFIINDGRVVDYEIE